MKTDHHQTPGGAEQGRRLRQRPLQFAEFVVDVNADRLKQPRRRMVATATAAQMRERQLRQRRGAVQSAVAPGGDDGRGQTSPRAQLAVVAQHAADLGLVGRGQPVAGADALLGVHAHIQGSVAHKTETALGRQTLKRGANPNLTNNKGETPLHRAAQRGRRGAFDVLLKRGAKPEIEDEAGRTALAVSRDGRTRRALAAAIANRPDRNGRTALHLAALHEPDAVSDLLSRGLNANAQDNDGNTALMVGILVNRMSEETAKDLLAGGANFFLGNRAGDLPLHAAAARGMTGAVRALISAGARGDRRRRDGWLPLQLAAAHGGDIQPPSGADYAGTARELLRGAGADASASAPNGRAPIHLAAENGDGDLASVLLGAGADVNAMIGGDGADAGALAADVAAGRGDYETLELLLGAGAKLSNGKALAADAARGGDAVLLRLLLEGGVEGEADYYASGVSAAVGEILGEWGILDLLFAEREGGARRGHLHFAARNGDAGEVLALLGYGAAVDLEDEEGRTALHFALAGGHDEIAALLLSAGANAAAGE